MQGMGRFQPLGRPVESRYRRDMTPEVVAKVISVTLDEDGGGYLVEFWVGQELNDQPTLSEAFAVLGSMDGLQREIFSFVVRWEDEEYTMEPDEALAECLALFDKHDAVDELGSPLDRQWKTGQVAEALVTHLVNSNLFGVWRTVDADSEAETEENN